MINLSSIVPWISMKNDSFPYTSSGRNWGSGIGSIFFWGEEYLGGDLFVLKWYLNREFVVAGLAYCLKNHLRRQVWHDFRFSEDWRFLMNEMKRLRIWVTNWNQQNPKFHSLQPLNFLINKCLGNSNFSLQCGHPKRFLLNWSWDSFMAGTTSMFHWLIHDQSRGRLGQSNSVPQKSG